MQKQQIATAGIAALLALTAACGAQSPTSPGPAASSGGPVRTDLPLTGVRWKVDSLAVAGREPAVPAAATMEISPDGRITLGTGCNGYSGRVRVAGDEITVVGGLNRTFTGCAMFLEQYEEAVGDAFKGPLTAAVSGSAADDRNLVLTSRRHPGTRVTLTTRPAAPLTGTHWTVVALTGLKSSTGLPEKAAGRARFVLGKDGTVSGSLGCNSFHGSARISGSTVTFGRIVSTRMACSPEVTRVEQGMLKVLHGEVGVQVSHRALFLKAENGDGLAAETADGAGN
ncbi:META domain-containing protein [Streptomyces fuscigenes]|uniref:META domain-containing protein n=1 Tax=Streptomyces fuscigenes TaxID=1528880 RepID=UPI001F45BE75|nr:META domain-containing protein [Streptomyces fuscigenes]MCF3962791.1 META domain-containing protein [Streptomyces fuscigenes]